MAKYDNGMNVYARVCAGYLRVCTYCCKVAMQYANNLDAACDDLQPANDDNPKPLPTLSESSSIGGDPADRPASESSRAWSTPPPTIGRKSSKVYRLSSIFDEDLKQR